MLNWNLHLPDKITICSQTTTYYDLLLVSTTSYNYYCYCYLLLRAQFHFRFFLYASIVIASRHPLPILTTSVNRHRKSV